MTRNQYAFEAITGYSPRAEAVSPAMEGYELWESLGESQ
jgi:hypothetical protein